VSKQRAGIGEKGPMCSYACHDAAAWCSQHRMARLIPVASREAAGSPAPLRYA
jgi:hypothetical protein